MKILQLTPELKVLDAREELREHVEPLRNPKHQKWQRRTLRSISILAVHHEGGAKLPDVYDEFEEVKRDARYHVTKNWNTDAAPAYAPNITYHTQIGRSGDIYLCNDWEEITWHANNANKYAIGICMHGNFELQEPTAAQLRSLRLLLDYLIAWREDGRKVISAGQADTYGHKELKGTVLGLKYTWKPIDLGNYTACPAAALQYVEEYRKTGTILKAAVTNPPLPSNPVGVEARDLEPNQWYYKFAKTMLDTGLMRGFEDGTWRPAQSVSRAELAKIAVGIAMNLDKIKKSYEENSK